MRRPDRHDFRLKANITSNQKAFDAACRHFASQKRRAMGAEDICAYSVYNGDRCAVGALVPVKTAQVLEEEYSGLGVDDLPINYGDVGTEFLNDLQQTHDSAVSLNYLLEGLHTLARLYDLRTDAIGLITEWEG